MPSIQLLPSQDTDILVSLLHDAEEVTERIVADLADSRTVGYVALEGETPVGAVVVRWDGDDSEIMYIATVEALRGQGYGKAMIRALLDEARARGVNSICVGTANSSLDNIAFYQKCGFRIDSVRKDYFAYLPTPIYISGILIQDMIVLRHTLTNADSDV